LTRKVLYEVRGPKTLYEMTWEEAGELFEKTDIAIIPVGSVEQHGLHLPLGSDSIQADDLVRRVVASCEGKGVAVIAAPTIPFGISHHHMKFPGSITLSSTTLSAIIVEMVGSLYRHGARKFVFILGHGGNLATLKITAQDLAAEMEDCVFLVPDWLPIIYAKYREVLKSERWQEEHHSGEGETARMIASTPKLVQLEKAEVYYTPPELDPYRKPAYGGSSGREDGAVGMKEATPIGSMGNPKLATAETGEKLYEIAVDWLTRCIVEELAPKKKQKK